VIHRLNNCVWNKEELPDEWKESISLIRKKGDAISLIRKKGDETDSNNYHGTSLLSTP
jgi:hypothetical protein